VPFADADDFHPSHIAKMTAGQSLDTTTLSVARSDRQWLAQHCGDGG